MADDDNSETCSPAQTAPSTSPACAEELDSEPPRPRPRSVIADEVERLKRAVIDAASTRSRLPQPMFWSLFGNELRQIKAKKDLKRTVGALFGEEES